MTTHTAPTRPDLSAMTGLEQLQALLDGHLPPPSMAATLNFTLTRIAAGEAEFRGTPTTDFLNPMGIVHGGWAMTLLDSALGCAVHTTLNPGEGYVSLDTDTKFVKAITPQAGELIVIGRVQTRGRQIVTAEGTLTDASGRVLALGTSSCLIRPLAG